jgi:hypothetical protein
MVKTLDYKQEVSLFETRWANILNLPSISDRTRASGLLSL